MNIFGRCVGWIVNTRNLRFRPNVDGPVIPYGETAVYTKEQVQAEIDAALASSNIVVTYKEDGTPVCVSRQDEEGRIISVLWELYLGEDTDFNKKQVSIVPLNQKVLDHCWNMYQIGKASADHTDKEAFEQTLQSLAASIVARDYWSIV